MTTPAPQPRMAPETVLTCIIENLCRWIAERIVQTVPQPLAGPLCRLIWNRLRRISLSFAALAKRARAKPLRCMAARKPRAPQGEPPQGEPAQGEPAGEPAQGELPPAERSGAAPRKARPPSRFRHLPRRFGWLVTLVPVTVNARAPIAHLLAQPEMAALLASSPQYGNIIRPLLRMLGMPEPEAMKRRNPVAEAGETSAQAVVPGAAATSVSATSAMPLAATAPFATPLSATPSSSQTTPPPALSHARRQAMAWAARARMLRGAAKILA